MISLAAAQEPSLGSAWRPAGLATDRRLRGPCGRRGLCALGYAGGFGEALWPRSGTGNCSIDLPLILEDLGCTSRRVRSSFREPSRADHSFQRRRRRDAQIARRGGSRVARRAGGPKSARHGAAPPSSEHLRRRLEPACGLRRPNRQHRLRAAARQFEPRSQRRRGQLRNVLVWSSTPGLETSAPSCSRASWMTWPDGGADRPHRADQARAGRSITQEELARKGPSDEDLVAILAWLDDFAWQHRQAVARHRSPTSVVAKYIDEAGRRDSKRRALIWMVQHSRGTRTGPKASIGEQARFRLDLAE